MATTRNKRVPMQEQIKLINECRKSGLTDADWCREMALHQVLFITGSADAVKQRLIYRNLIMVIMRLLSLSRM